MIDDKIVFTKMNKNMFRTLQTTLPKNEQFKDDFECEIIL